MTQSEIIQKKCLSGKDISRSLAIWKFQNKKIVFTNGCFDLLHLGHIDYLSKAKDLGDILIVGINSDASVRRIKGEHRPIQDEVSRVKIMASLLFVDAVIIFDEDTPLELIKTIQPDVLVKGADYNPKDIVGYDVVTANNGTVETLEFLEGFSTSAIEKRIRETNPMP